MRKVRCPRCDNALFVDPVKYSVGQSIRLHCDQCGRDFGIRIKQKENQTPVFPYGKITVLEDGCCYRQELPLRLGENVIGRRSRGNTAYVQIETGDDDLARNHCVIDIKQDKTGQWVSLLRDYPSIKGTFLRGAQLNKQERIQLQDQDVIIVGSTTFIFTAIQPEAE